ncbi:MAG: hypothetical protein CMJ47_13815 [Planctomyces sp.]|nr:hypothetical protein [Planctomyces sp.]
MSAFAEMQSPAELEVMTASSTPHSWQERFIQRYLLPSIAFAYVVAALWPACGLWLRSYSLTGGDVAGIGSATPVNLLLAALLFNTGLAVPLRDLFSLNNSVRVVSLGLSIRLTTGTLIILAALGMGLMFHGPLWDQILLGTILITIMPVANSSAGWAHHSEANVGLSMWLILISVLLSPWLVPGLLSLASWMTPAEMDASYQKLAQGYAGSFVMTWVIIPAVLGMGCRSLLMRHNYGDWKIVVKSVTYICLVLLNYANGSVSLPEVVRGGEGRLVSTSFLTATALCALLFAAAWVVGRLCRLTMRSRLSVMYSTAMSNTGVALVLSTTILPQAEALHLVVIFYTLLQHIGAGIVDQLDYCWRRVHLADSGRSLTNSSMMTTQPVSTTPSSERPTTQTGSQAAMMEPVAPNSKGS